MDSNKEKEDVWDWMRENDHCYESGGTEVFQFTMSTVLGYAKHYHEKELMKINQSDKMVSMAVISGLKSEEECPHPYDYVTGMKVNLPYCTKCKTYLKQNRLL